MGAPNDVTGKGTKEKGTSIKVGTQMFKKVPIGDLGTKN